ncbi:hypothetical protein GCM10022421_32150 [Oceanisphaera sediminis]|uniref:SlyX protein n=1 Tax=Oceanisphaera sediminis TaxID=981381 RepID=A0ABP7EP61_9GAMM
MDTDALLIELIEALQRQTAVIADQAEAINRMATSNERLADSNQQLIAAMAEMDAQEANDADMPQATYLDGTPC